MSENLLSSPFLYNLSLTLIHFLWQGVLVALVLKVALLVISTDKPQWRYVLSSLAMVISLLLPVVTFFVIYQPEYQNSSSVLGIADFLISDINNSQQNSSIGLIEYLPYLSLAWLAIIFVLAMKLLLELYNVNQLPKKGIVTPDKQLVLRFNKLVCDIKLDKVPRLLVSLTSEVPMAIGWLKPVVLIPASMISGLTPAQLDMLILHELAHIRRHDYLVNFIQTLVELLLFFHPSIRWISKQMRNEREYCSDDIAVQHCGSPIAYAHTLADTASLCQKHRHHSIPAMAMAASGGDLKKRVLRLVDQEHHCSNNNTSGKWLASLIIITSVLFVSIKKHIPLPVLDLSSGTISLYRAANDSFSKFKQYNNDTKALPSTSLALQLLNRDKQLAKSDVVIEKALLPVNVVKENTSNNIQTNNNITYIEDDAVNQTNSEVLALNEKVIDKPYENTIKDTSFEIKTIHSSDIVNELAFTKTDIIKKKKNIIAPVTKKQVIEKSISDLAFERTDSNNLTSLFNNPYAAQISALSEPLPKTNTYNVDSSITPIDNLSATSSVMSQNNWSSPAVEKTAEPKNILAQIIKSTEPKYPSNAKRKGLELDVQIYFTIDKSGYVKDITYQSKGRVNYFRSAIRNAMEKWRFVPATVNGKAVESTMSKIFSFSLTK
jgi:TonB family protein